MLSCFGDKPNWTCMKTVSWIHSFYLLSFRHGIDLDNPGPGTNPVSLLAAGLTSGVLSGDGSLENSLGALGSLGPGLSVSVAASYSDSGDSNGARSTDNATPPMHYLTPHVEISMADNETYSPGQSNNSQGMLNLSLLLFQTVFMNAHFNPQVFNLIFAIRPLARYFLNMQSPLFCLPHFLQIYNFPKSR